jgi:cation diffusion facilitator CzcD-associated flavoprotein CzcO
VGQESPIAEGGAILHYLRSAAAYSGVDKRIEFVHRLVAAEWSSAQHLWRLNVDTAAISKQITARFVLFCTGYYNYHTPLQADIPHLDQFSGEVPPSQ